MLVPSKDSAVAAVLIVLLALSLRLASSNDNESTNKQAPKDYSYSPKASRVRDLAGFFESIQRRNSDPASAATAADDHKQDLLISLGEAASKLHLLMDGFPMEVRCNRYVKLIDRPNIRTFATVNLLANEDKHFNEIEQNDVNLLSRLQNERSFDALGKSQSIIQSLDSERNNMRSDYDTEVQLDLLGCINYYIYRHQRATLGLIDYVRAARAKLEPNAATSAGSHSKVALEKYRELLAAIKAIEAREPQRKDNLAWLRAFAKMHDLVLENEFQLPKLVQDFVTEPKRLGRLRSFDEVLSEIDQVEKSILKHEADDGSDDLEQNENYRGLLFRLSDMVKEFGDLLPESSRKLVESPNRKRLIEDQAVRSRLRAVDAKEQLNGTADNTASKQKSDSNQDVSSSENEEDEFFDPLDYVDDEQSEAAAVDSTTADTSDEPALMSVDSTREKLVNIGGKYVTGFSGQQVGSKCQETLDGPLSDSAPKSTCARHAFELSVSLRLFDDASLKFEWAKLMAESVGRFMVDCLMRSSY